MDLKSTHGRMKMRRSEIINMIQHILDSVNPSHANTPYILLDSLENAGMQPPKYHNPEYYEASGIVEISAWEPELPAREEAGQ